MYSRYDNWHPIVFGKVGYAICQVVPQKSIGAVDRFCRGIFQRGFLAGESRQAEKFWQVELLLSGVDPKRDHPLLVRKSQDGGYQFDTPFEAVVEGVDGVRHGNAIFICRAPNHSYVLTTAPPACGRNRKVTIEIWHGGTNAVCSVVVRNPLRSTERR